MANENIWGPLYNVPQNQLHSPEVTAQEVVWLDSFLDGLQEEAILDLGAGFGRHVKGLRDLGYKKVIAVENEPDSVTELLNNSILVVERDFRRMPFVSTSVCAAYSWFGTLFSGTHEQNEQALQEASRVIRRGGLLIVQQANFQALQKLYAKPTVTEITLPDGSELLDGGYILPTGEFRGVRSHNGLKASYSIFYYPERVLRGLFERHGFDVKLVENNEIDTRIVGVRRGA